MRSKSGMKRKQRIINNIKPSKRKSNAVNNIPTDTGPLACAVCGLMMFEDKAALLFHVKYHYHREPIECPICCRIFFTKAGLKSHTKSHVNEKNLLCGYCGKLFIRAGSLKTHLITHTNDCPTKTHICPICNKAFKFELGLENHMKNHTRKMQLEVEKKLRAQQENLIEGPIIPVVFESGNNGLKTLGPPIDGLKPLKTLKTEKPITIAPKPVKCPNCSRSFYDLNNLKDHMKKVHCTTASATTIKCPSCLKSFPDTKKLNDHMNTHNEVYKCSLCNSFINGGDLRDHIQYHSSQKGSKVLLFNKL